MDYNTLIGPKGTAGTIANWMAYSDSVLPLADILTEAQAEIYKSLRVREMIVSDYTLVLAQGAINAPLPAGFLDPINCRDLYNMPMYARDLSTIKRHRGLNPLNQWIQGLPRLFAIAGSTVEFEIACDASAAGTYRMDYFGTPAALGPGNLTNFLTLRYPKLLRYACMMAAADFLNDSDRVGRYGQLMAGQIGEIEINNELAMRGAEVEPDYSEAY